MDNIGRGTAQAAANGPADFNARIYALVARIPPGCVASYGQLALLAGAPRWSRKAGRAMANAPPNLPCHRVVNSAGRLVPGWEEQRTLLRQEGVTFANSGNVNMKKHRWKAVFGDLNC